MMVPTLLKRFRSDQAPSMRSRLKAPGDALLSSELMASLQRLTLSAPRVQQGTFAGEHRSRRHGSSPEFADYRRYSPGDDIRRVDWNLYARFDELFIRLSEVTTDLSVHLLVDSSSSMDWRSSPDLPTKHRFAQQIAAAFGYAALWHFDRIKITPYAHARDAALRPVQGRTRIPELLTWIDTVQADGFGSLADRLASYGHRDPSPGLLLVLSDLMSDDANQLSTPLRGLRGRGWDVAIIQILDPAEREPARLFPKDSRTGEPTTLIDSELGTKVMMNPGEAAFEHYRSSFGSWLDEIGQMCGRHGVTWIPLETSQPIESVVVSLLNDFGLLQ